MCGIVGIVSQENVASELHSSLIHLQHRGQDAAGIITCNDRFHTKHGLGLVREIFTERDILALKGNMGIAHTRYPTAGGYDQNDIQPLWLGNPRGIALAHNGNLVNYSELAETLCGQKHRHFDSSLDSEALLHLLADHLATGSYADDEDIFFQQLQNAVHDIFQRVSGSYSVVAMVMGKGMIAFRDPYGIRPLVYGERTRDDGKKDYIFASENTPFYALGFEMVGDVQPGELVFVTQSGKLYRKTIASKPFSPCVFEYVYFARPDATLNQVSVYRSRLRMGQNLAKQWQAAYPDVKPDVVIPAPFTANTAALSFAHELGVRYSEGLYKNPFIGRTFIMSSPLARQRGVQYKLTPQKTEIEHKKVLIVDDSIVRGTTSREIIKMVKEVGAKEIYFVSTCPPIRFPCFYGIDIPSSDELIAANQSLDEIKAYLGVDLLLYQSQDDLIEAVTRRGEHHMSRPCMACMDGRYIAGEMDEAKIKQREQEREKAR